jgi:hypothetical protein
VLALDGALRHAGADIATRCAKHPTHACPCFCLRLCRTAWAEQVTAIIDSTTSYDSYSGMAKP